MSDSSTKKHRTEVVAFQDTGDLRGMLGVRTAATAAEVKKVLGLREEFRKERIESLGLR